MVKRFRSIGIALPAIILVFAASVCAGQNAAPAVSEGAAHVLGVC